MLDGSRWFSVDAMVERDLLGEARVVLYQDEKPVDWRAWAAGTRSVRWR